MEDKAKTCISPSGWPPPDDPGGRQDTAVSGVTSPDNLQKIRAAIRNKYAEVSHSAEGKFRYPTGKDGAIALGYDSSILKDIQAEILNSFCGVGNPFSVDEIKPGSAVLDIGCGAGFDLVVASRLTGPQGRVCGIDLTEEMIVRAKENLARLVTTNIEIKHVDSEEIPYAGQSFYVVISNGVINLSPCKQDLFGEIYRVLKPGGKLQFADIVSDGEVPPYLRGSLDAWAQWIGGTIPVRDQISLMEQAGFTDVEYVGETGFRTSQYTIGALFKAVR